MSVETLWPALFAICTYICYVWASRPKIRMYIHTSDVGASIIHMYRTVDVCTYICTHKVPVRHGWSTRKKRCYLKQFSWFEGYTVHARVLGQNRWTTRQQKIRRVCWGSFTKLMKDETIECFSKRNLSPRSAHVYSTTSTSAVWISSASVDSASSVSDSSATNSEVIKPMTRLAKPAMSSMSYPDVIPAISNSNVA